MIVQDAKAAFPDYSDEQIWDFALQVIRKAIATLENTPKQLNFKYEWFDYTEAAKYVYDYRV